MGMMDLVVGCVGCVGCSVMTCDAERCMVVCWQMSREYCGHQVQCRCWIASRQGPSSSPSYIKEQCTETTSYLNMVQVVKKVLSLLINGNILNVLKINVLMVGPRWLHMGFISTHPLRLSGREYLIGSKATFEQKVQSP